jgi:hypothetical protein
VSTICDSTTMDLLHRILGMRLEKVYARRYPGNSAYSQVITHFAQGLSICFDLSDEVVAPKFEVFVARVRLAELPGETIGWDRFELDDFVVASAYLLRRKEWIEHVAPTHYQTIGLHSVEQKFGDLSEADGEHESALVDSGVCLISMSGAELSFDADAFPLVLQLRYEVAPTSLPVGERIPVN